jgi:hypothetical protein
VLYAKRGIPLACSVFCVMVFTLSESSHIVSFRNRHSKGIEVSPLRTL